MTEEDLSQPTPEEIYYAAEQYLPYLPVELQASVAGLLEEARAGHKRDSAILSVMSEDADARRWLRAALFGDMEKSVLGEYGPLAGGPDVPANSRWKCPECGFVWHVSRKGRPVPPCPKCKIALKKMKQSSVKGARDVR